MWNPQQPMPKPIYPWSPSSWLQAFVLETKCHLNMSESFHLPVSSRPVPSVKYWTSEMNRNVCRPRYEILRAWSSQMPVTMTLENAQQVIPVGTARSLVCGVFSADASQSRAFLTASRASRVTALTARPCGRAPVGLGSSLTASRRSDVERVGASKPHR